MSLRLYMDHNVPKAVVDGCRLHRIDVMTAFEDGSHRRSDRWLLDRATELNRILVTQDEDFLVEANRRQKAGIHFAGIVYAHALTLTIGDFIFQLRLVCELCQPSEIADTVIFLPL